MESKDLFELVSGLIWGAGMFILWRRNKSKPKMWPPIFAIGGGTYVFLLLIIENILRGPKSEFVQDTVTSFLLSLVFGIGCYFGGHILVRRFGKQ